jgi:hypothetical protein
VIQLSSSVLGQGSSQRAAPGTAGAAKIDAVSRATTSSVLISDAIVRGIVGRSRGILPPVGTRTARLDIDRFAPADWPELEAAGAISHLRLLNRDVSKKLGEPGVANGAAANPAPAPDAVFVDFYVALVTPAAIGINILAKTWYDQYTAGCPRGEAAPVDGAGAGLLPRWRRVRPDTPLPGKPARRRRSLSRPARLHQLRPALSAAGDLRFACRGRRGRGEGKPGQRLVGSGRDGCRLEEHLARPPGQDRHPRGRALDTHRDPVHSGLRHPPAALASLDSHRFLELDPRLAGLVRRGAAHRGQFNCGYPCLVHGFPMGFCSRRSADRDALGIYAGGTVPMGPRYILRLALSVRSAPGTGQHGGATVQGPTDQNTGSVARAADRREVLAFSRPCGGLVLFGGSGHEWGRSGALQGRHHPSLHDRMADGRLRARANRGERLCRKVLLPLHLPARRRPLDIRPGADVQLAEAASGMRHAMPHLRVSARWARSSEAERST